MDSGAEVFLLVILEFSNGVTLYVNIYCTFLGSWLGSIDVFELGTNEFTELGLWGGRVLGTTHLEMWALSHLVHNI